MSISINQFFKDIFSNEEIAIIASKTFINGNSFNSANDYTNFKVAALSTAEANPLVKLFAANNQDFLAPVSGLVKLYGMGVARHLCFNKLQYVPTDNAKAVKNKQDEKAVKAFLLNFTKLCMSQKTEGDSILSCPVTPAQEFVALAPFWGMQAVSLPANIAGWDIISAVGDNLTGKAFSKTEMKAVEVKIAALFNVKKEDVKYALGTAAGKDENYSKATYLVGLQTYFLSLSRPDQTFLVDKHVYDFMVGMFTAANVATNVIAIDSGWTDYMKFRVNHEHVYHFCQNLVANIPTDPASRKKPLTSKLVSGKDTSPTNFCYELTFEEAYTIIVTHEGVFEKDRRRSLYSQIVVNQQALTYCKGDLQNEDMYLRNHYAVLLQYLVMNALQFTLVNTRLASFYSRKVAIELPWVAEEDQGPVDGDRNAVQRSTATTVTSQDFVAYKYGANNHVDFTVHSSTPFTLTNVKGDVNHLVTRKYYIFKQTSHAAYRVDNAAFTKLNLVRNKENFVDGRRVALQCRHIPKKYRLKVVQTICERAFKLESVALDAAVIKEFKLEAAGYTHDELWKFIAEDLVIGLSSKLAKLVKRAVMYAAQIGRITGGESRSLRQYGQKAVSNNCAAVKAIIGICTNAAPGMAEFYRDDLVTMEVDRTADRTFSINAHQINGVIQLEWGALPQPNKVSMDGLYRVYTWTPGVELKMGETICSVPYTYDKVGSRVEYAEVKNEYESAHLQEVRIRFVRYGASWQTELDYTVVSYETTIKVRGILKAMAIRADESSVKNGLNAYEGIAFEADALFHRDTNKWLDTTHGLLDCIYMTARKNPQWIEANETIAAIDAAIGVDKQWAPVLDLMGIYDTLRAMFYAKFGKMFWVQHEEHNTGVETSAILLQYHMYRKAEGWQPLAGVPANMLAMLPAGFNQHVCLVQTKMENPTWDVIKDSTENVLIFGFNEDKTAFYQAHRSFVYVGTAECPLYMPVKGEMASVGSLVGTTKMMMGCIRNIAIKDPVFANLCVKANFNAYDKYAAFLAMANSKEMLAKDGMPIKTVYLNSIDEEDNVSLTASAKALLCNEKVAAIYAATKPTGTFLKALAQEFGDTRFVIKVNESVKVDMYDTNPNAKTEFKRNEFSLYLPVIVAQSAAAGYKHTDDMSSNVQALFTYLHQGSDWVKHTDEGIERNGYIHNLCARIRGAIIGLTNSETISKCAAFGPVGVQGKPTSLYGVRLDEVYVRKSDKFDSVYQTMLRTYKLKPSELPGHAIVFSRSPMTATAKLRIVVIKDNHWAAAYVPIHSFVMNPLACYYHRGDYDGDLNALFSATIDGIMCNLPYLTNTMLIESIVDSTGKNHLQPGGSYYGDGFEIPTLASVYKKMEFKTGSLTLLSSNKNMLDPHSTDKASLGQLLAGSTKMLKEAVGNIHRVWITNDIFISAMSELMTALEATQVLATNYHPELFIGLVQILAEIYEVPLGGYDEAAYIVFYQHLFNKDVALNAAAIEGLQNINGEGEVIDMSLDTLSGIMTAAGMNGLTQYTVTGADAGDQVVNIPAAVTKAVELSEYANSGLGINLQILVLHPLTWAQIVTKLGIYKAIEFFLFLTTYIGVSLSKGLFNPALVKTGTATVVIDNDYDSDYGEEEADAPLIPVDKQAIDLYQKAVVGLGLSQEFLDNSVMFSGIEYYINTVEAAMNDKAVSIDTAFFYKEKVEVAVDEAAVRAGVSMSFVGLNSPLQEVEAPKVVVKAEAPAVTAQEIAARKQQVLDYNPFADDGNVATVTTQVTTQVTTPVVIEGDPFV